ncbi:MAG: Hpt domain-containing protein [Polyangiaceae bacterium]
MRDIVDEDRFEGGRYVTEIETAVVHGDVERWQRSAHALKGASSSVGAPRVAWVAREIEHATTIHVDEHVDRLAAAFREATAALTRRLTEHQVVTCAPYRRESGPSS